MAARIDTTHGFDSKLERLFQMNLYIGDPHGFVVSKDGQRILYAVRDTTSVERQRLSVVLNWPADLPK